MASTAAGTGRHLKNLAGFTGLSCIVIGIYHFALGTASVPGATDANATVDSRERFYSAYFAGYGLAWLSAARRSPIRAGEVRLLAGLMLVSAVGRVISLGPNGRPHWVPEALPAGRVLAPAPLFGLARRHQAPANHKRRSRPKPSFAGAPAAT